MKLHVDDDMMIKSSNMSSRKFTIATSPKVFKILSQNLYSNQIRAIIRELSCNAADAHTLAGHTKQFDITLPTSLDERFIVRDYGPGLSHEDIEEMYTTYFESTKSNSNDFIGALGLGSKSPFGYTDTFSVVSYFDGRARGYTACLDNGEPTLIDTFDIESDEPSGLEITVPVKKADQRYWIEEAQYVFKSFLDIKPKFIGIDPGISYLENKPYFIKPSESWRTGGAYYAIMGKIVYPLKREFFDGSYIQIVMDSGSEFYVNFDLGDLDITPSREEISFDERTKENVTKRIKEISDIMAKDFLDKLNNYSDRELIQYLDGKTSNLNRYTETNYKDRDVKKLRHFFTQSVLDKDGISYKFSREGKPKRINIYAGVHRHHNLKYNGLMDLFPITIKQATVVIDDVKGKNKLLRMTNIYNQSKLLSDMVMVLEKHDPDFEKVKAQISKLMDNNITFINMSEYSPVSDNTTNEKKPKTPNVNLKQLSKCGKYFEQKELCLTASEIRDLKGPAVKMYKTSLLWNNGVGISSFHLDDLARFSGVQMYYVIKPSANKYASGLTNLEDIIAEKIKSTSFEKHNIIPEYTSDNFIARLINNDVIWLLNLLLPNSDYNKETSSFLKYCISTNISEAVDDETKTVLNLYKSYVDENRREIEKSSSKFVKRNRVLSESVKWTMDDNYQKELKLIFEGNIK